MKRVVALAVACAAAPLLAAGCGSDRSGSGTLPPIATTTSTTTTLATTTTLPEFYVVQAGDTLSKIVNKLGVTKNDLMALNGITDPDHIERGQKLKVPRPGVPIPSTEPPSTTIAPETTAAG
jgi:LysM repeat protein